MKLLPAKRFIRSLFLFMMVGVIFLISQPASENVAQATTMSELARGHGCDGVAPLTSEACCAFGYIYYNDAPVEGAEVRIESATGVFTATTAYGTYSDNPYYTASLTDAPLSSSTGELITITVSYEDMVSTRTWTVQPGSQQVDIGLIEGYQASEALSADSTFDEPAADIQASGYTAVLAGASADGEEGQAVSDVANLSYFDAQAITTTTGKLDSSSARIVASSVLSITEAKLTANDGASEDFFGYSVSIDGNVALVGAYQDNDNGSISGSAYIYRWNGNDWEQEAKLSGRKKITSHFQLN